MSDWEVIEGDCLDVLPTLGPVDHVITDPPYDERTHAPGRARSLKDGGSNIPIDFAPLSDFGFVPALLKASRRWVIAFCALEQLGEYQKAFGHEAWTRAGIWHRLDGTPQLSGDRPAQTAEGIAIAHNPAAKRSWNRGGGRGLWAQGVERNDRAHPTQKPIKLMLRLIEDFTDPGDLILDPFCGSGTTGVAALRLGRRFIGVELKPKWAELARERLRAEEKQSTLTAQRAGQVSIFEALSSTGAADG